MLKIFKNSDIINYPTSLSPAYLYIDKMLTREKERVKHYYRNKEMTVSNQNFLSRIIDFMSVDITYDFFVTLPYIEEKAYDAHKYFKLVSDTNRGEVLSNKVYGKYSKEYFLYKESEIDIMSIKDKWSTLPALRCLSHGDTDLLCEMPNEKDMDLSGEIRVFTLDLTLLGVQYYYWSLERKKLNKEINSNIFVKQIVHTNLLDSNLEVSILNRFMYKFKEIDLEESKNTHPIIVKDYSKKIDKEFSKTIKDLKGSRKYFVQLLKNIPTLNNGSTAYSTLFFPSYYLTNMNKYFIYISYLKYMDFLLTFLDDKSLRKEKGKISDLRIGFKDLRVSNIDLTKFKSSDFNSHMVVEGIRKHFTNIENKIGKR